MSVIPHEPQDTGTAKPITLKGHGGELVSLRGAVDLHLHTYPDLFPRLVDDIELARFAAQSDMRAVVIKSHIESSVSRAYLAQQVVPEVLVFGGIVLNSYVGGINPAAVDTCLKLGGKIVWMPTIDSAYHALKHGGTGKYDSQAGGRVFSDGISIIDDNDKLIPDMSEVIEITAEYGAAMATSHLSPKEIKILVPEALKRGVEKVIITHPYFKVPMLEHEDVVELAKLGAMPEFEYCGMSPAWQYQSPERVVKTIQAVGASRCLLVSDSGQRHNPPGPEALRVLAQTLYEKGIPLDDVVGMLVDNPAYVLGLDGYTGQRTTPVEG
ncbi:DUF6282 family protein [Pseudactinotalea sp. HY158]|uniref:DUF6282 family protein n=1 Tax=Pseudactinotalea sp. HY158 TaxID=2654547 RepID=UPI00129CC49B|nr:DUF6282 family protein [Pseudactinotalea sp. HY158]QGH70710.1 hypothetical protein GCE65_15315 [Pseudactinotalea sp. HY158]